MGFSPAQYASLSRRATAPAAAGGMPVEFTIPYPPSVNNLYATRHGKRVLKSEGRQYKATAAALAYAAGVRPMDGEVCVTIRVYRPAKRGDLDNSCKIVLDSLTGIAYRDDGQVGRIVIDRFEDKDNPRAVVRVTKRL